MNEVVNDKLIHRTGAIYVPPSRLLLGRDVVELSDKTSEAYQRASWDALKKSLNGLINKVNTSNIKNIVIELFSENLIRGRGLFARSMLKAQASSLPFTPVFATLAAVLNSKLPLIGELVIKRLILQFRRSYKRNDKTLCLASVTFLAQLINQQVAHELLALELLTLLLERPTDDSVEIAVGFLRECGAMLTELTPKGMDIVFERFRQLLLEPEEKIKPRVQWMIQVLFQVRKEKFKDNIAVKEELDLVDEEDRITHTFSLASEEIEDISGLLVFKYDPDFAENEKKYADIKEEIIGNVDLAELAAEGDQQEDQEGIEAGTANAALQEVSIKDKTEINLVNLRKVIYLTIMSSLDFEECCHKILKTTIPEETQVEVCGMIIECCSQERIYSRFYGLLAERLCLVHEKWAAYFVTCFRDTYAAIHRYETNRIRNVAKLFAFLLARESMDWESSLSVIILTENDTSSASRIFIKFLFTELSQEIGIKKLSEKLGTNVDSTAGASAGLPLDAYSGLFPTDSLKNSRFAINFFTAIELGPLTDRLRVFFDIQLQKQQSLPNQQSHQENELSDASSSSLDLSDISDDDSEAAKGSVQFDKINNRDYKSSSMPEISSYDHSTRHFQRHAPSRSRSPNPRYRRRERRYSSRSRSPYKYHEHKHYFRDRSTSPSKRFHKTRSNDKSISHSRSPRHDPNNSRRSLSTASSSSSRYSLSSKSRSRSPHRGRGHRSREHRENGRSFSRSRSRSQSHSRGSHRRRENGRSVSKSLSLSRDHYRKSDRYRDRSRSPSISRSPYDRYRKKRRNSRSPSPSFRHDRRLHINSTSNYRSKGRRD